MRLLHDTLDVPLASMFLSQYILAGGWPHALVEDYHQLGLFMIALATFASTRDTLLRNIGPSKLAAAALALAVKIVNGDRGADPGLSKHLPECAFEEQNVKTNGLAPGDKCICRYEFWPLRLQHYANFSFDELKPVIRGLSNLLRVKRPEVRKGFRKMKQSVSFTTETLYMEHHCSSGIIFCPDASLKILSLG